MIYRSSTLSALTNMLLETGRASRLEVHLGHCLGRLIGRCKADEAKALASSGSLASCCC